MPALLASAALLLSGLTAVTTTSAVAATVSPARVLLTGGAAQVGRTYTPQLMADTSGTSLFRFPDGVSPRYRWYRGPQPDGFVPTTESPADHGFVAIPGATSAAYHLVDADHGSSVVLAVRSVDSAGRVLGLKTSAVSNRILWDGAPPTLSGAPLVGRTLTADIGRWESDWNITLTWRREYSEIPGANTKSYTLTAADAGKTVSLLVLADYVYPNGVHAIDRYASRVRVRHASASRIAATSPRARTATLQPRLLVPTVSPSQINTWVRLYDGSHLLMKKSLIGGKRTVTITGLRRGRHFFRTVFPGSQYFAPSRSGTYLTVR